ncbi:gap junction delta-4 protein [Pipistrellus kuhlii]|uniref:Gap junction protein n=1 Tax=Pipistrellus kuhlii TaxID=59472 RepID=A0A7J8B047_PIPKU|nr:gap junction delta-4 protein [Pipistrellus kuhlii]KAF6392068.1 gap junction protein delta 4 [Pipistrellus kuhlii]
MDRLDLLGFLIITLNCNVTIVGKIWLIFMILLRMVVIIVAGSPVYQDEQERFVCNTLQPGCANVCYDVFSPVSHLRFWLIQSLSVLLPSAVFSVYVLHKGAQLAAWGPCGTDGGSGSQDLADLSPRDRRCPLHCREGRSLVVPDFSSGYIVHLCLRTLAETAFGALHYLLFGFSVPNRFSCAHSPCSGAVDCYVSRPTEKSTLMLFLWALSALSVLLSVADLLCSLGRRMPRGPGPTEGPRERRPDPVVLDRPGEERVSLAHSGLCTRGHGAHSPSGQWAVSELPEDESEGLSLASDKLSRACTEPGVRPHAERPPDSESEHLSRPRRLLAPHRLSSPWQPAARQAGAGSAPPLGTRRSEWV